MSVPPIAISTGWLYAYDRTTFAEQQPFLDAVDGAELSVSNSSRFDTYQDLEICLGDEYEYLSFHLDENFQARDRREIATLSSYHDPETAVLHPVNITDKLVRRYLDNNVPVAIENMTPWDSDEGYYVNQLAGYRDRTNCGFVLDVEHCHEQDSSMRTAWEFTEMYGSRLKQLHVSGRNEHDKHALVRDAENQDAILEFLAEFYSQGNSVPLIIEGRYETVDDVREEYDLLRTTIEEAF